MSTEPLFEVRSVDKRFGATRALVGAGLEVRPGEVHALLGANGSGKSTLLKVLSGVVRADGRPRFRWRGEERDVPSDGDGYRACGWGFVHQDLGLLPSLRVVDNFHMSGAMASPGFALSWKRERREVERALEALDLDVDPRTQVDDLPRPTAALVAIARALHDASTNNLAADGRCVLFLDESTVSLEAEDRAELRRVIGGLTESGSSVVIVSHDLDEVRELTDRVTVLRNGRVAGGGETRELSHADLLALVVGPAADSLPEGAAGAQRPEAEGEVVLEVEGLTGSEVGPVSFSCRAGEIVGVTGLVGSGFEEVPYLLFGDPPEDVAGGAIRLAGKRLDANRLTPVKAIASGISLVPGSRSRQGIFADAPIWQNVTSADLGSFKGFAGFLRRGRERKQAAAVTEAVKLVPPDVGRRIGELSGGNQQKAVLAKWFHAHPKLLLLDEPTVGIDVGARLQINTLLREAADDGIVVLCASSDHDQLQAICDRVLVFRRGRIRAELSGSDLSAHRMAVESMREVEAEA